MKSFLKFVSIMRLYIILLSSLLILSCEDPIPNDYTETILMEGLLIVDEPIGPIRLTRTLPLNEPYYYGNALIRDADVSIYEGDNEIRLSFREFDSADIKKSGYYYVNALEYKVKPNKEYRLRVVLNNKREITGVTTTPGRIEWVKKMAEIIPYPNDTLNLPPSADGVSEWSRSNNGNAFYIYSVTCLDTLDYGKYLTPPTTDTNRRIRNRIDVENEILRSVEVSINSFMIINKATFNWNFCRWFGKHNLKVYVPDKNYERWFMYYLMLQDFSDKSYSVEGCAGYFGSASMIESEFFLQKNKYAKE